MPDRLIVIRDFERHFCVSQNAKIKGPMSWFAIPTKHDGKGFRRLMTHDHGAALYGAWVLMVAVGAKCEPKGVLIDDGLPLSTEDLELKTGCPARVFKEAIEVLSAKGIAWLDVMPHEAHATAAIDRSRAESSALPLQDRTRQDKTNSPSGQGAGPGIGKCEDGKLDGAPELPCLKAVGQKHLANTKALIELAGMIRTDRPGHIPDDDDGVLRVIAAAERAKAKGKDPAKLFRWLIRNQRWDMLDADEKSRAKQRLREARDT